MMSRSQRFGCFTRLSGCLIALAGVFGCASPGTPRAPSLHLPAKVKSLSAERHGNNVVVRFTTPERTTDDQPITTPVMASLCRAVADGPCGATRSFPGKVKIAGPVEWADVLPAGLAAGTPRRLTYRVELFNADGHSAGPSAPAFAAAGEAPRTVEAFQAEGSHAGIVLRWTAEAKVTGEVLVKREDLAAPPKVPPAKKAESTSKGAGGRKIRSSAPAKAGVGASKDESTVWLHAADAAPGQDRGGLIDATATEDEPYRYTAMRRRTVTLDGHELEMWSDASKGTEITLTDVFPPAVPQGLVAAGFPMEGAETLAADLVWQPDTESDLAGYNVYRQVLAADGSAAGAAVKLNATLVALPSFHDATVARRVAYRYTVTAVDSKGNESAASAAADLAATP
ncbi:MAG TPA: hypothetical protein VIJ79_06175 [Acidobacteriaceae bacterium]